MSSRVRDLDSYFLKKSLTPPANGSSGYMARDGSAWTGRGQLEEVPIRPGCGTGPEV